jgi:hypothetical protein
LAGSRDGDGQQQDQRVHDDVPLAALKLLAAVVAHGGAAGGGLDRLAVDAGGAGFGVAAGRRSSRFLPGCLYPRGVSEVLLI